MFPVPPQAAGAPVPTLRIFPGPGTTAPPPEDGLALLRGLAAEAVPAHACCLAVLSASGAAVFGSAAPGLVMPSFHLPQLALPAAAPARLEGDAVPAPLRAAGVAAALALPLRARGEAVGLLLLGRRAGEPPFGPEDAARAAGWARQAALVLDHAALLGEADGAREALRDAVEETHRSWARLRAVAAASRAAAEAAFDLQGVLDVTARSVSRILGDLCIVMLATEGDDLLTVGALHHPDAEAAVLLRRVFETAPPNRGEGFHAQVLRSGRALLLPQVTREELAQRLRPAHWPYVERYGISSLLIVPLRARERTVGALSISRVHGGAPYNGDDWSLLQDIADQAALAVDNARLYSAAREELARRTRAEQERERTLAELELERARLQATLESVPVGLYFAEAPDGRVVLANDALRRIFRAPLPPLSSERWEAARWVGFHPDGRPLEPEEWPITRALRGQTVQDAEFLCQCPDGVLRWLRANAAPVRDAAGATVAGVVVVAEIDRPVRDLADPPAAEPGQGHVRGTTGRGE